MVLQSTLYTFVLVVHEGKLLIGSPCPLAVGIIYRKLIHFEEATILYLVQKVNISLVFLPNLHTGKWSGISSIIHSYNAANIYFISIMHMRF